MQIQKGIVKYKDRNDIVCNYGVTDDGKQYYFLDVDELSNGNIIATTTLVEAIDSSAVPSSIGVITKEGEEVIPFENKSIKPIANGDILLVETAKPTTESVLESIKLRNDPLSATKLVTTPATIKDKMNAKMGSDGRFVFNDQFSEATVYDINGNNLIDHQYFSFIGINSEKLFFSKNVVDSEIFEYSLLPVGVQANVAEDQGLQKLDVEGTSVTKDVIDTAVRETEKEENSVSELPVVEENQEEPKEDENDDDSDTEGSSEEKKDEIVPENSVFEDDLKDTSIEQSKIEESVSSDDTFDSNGLSNDDSIDDHESSGTIDDMDTDLFTSDSVNESSIDSNVDFGAPVKDNIIEDVAETMTNLIQSNRAQKEKIEAYETKIDRFNSLSRQMTQKLKTQTREIEVLKTKVKNYEATVAKLEAKNQLLDSKVHDQERLLHNQKEELETLRPQVEGKKDLVRLIEDAQNLLGQSNY